MSDNVHMIEYKVTVAANGDRHWYRHGQLHREDGPAVEYINGSNIWYLNGKPHREDGPAIEWSNGSKEWYLNDEILTESEFNERMNPVEMTVAELADKLNIKNLKIVK